MILICAKTRLSNNDSLRKASDVVYQTERLQLILQRSRLLHMLSHQRLHIHTHTPRFFKNTGKSLRSDTYVCEGLSQHYNLIWRLFNVDDQQAEHEFQAWSCAPVSVSMYVFCARRCVCVLAIVSSHVDFTRHVCSVESPTGLLPDSTFQPIMHHELRLFLSWLYTLATALVYFGNAIPDKIKLVTQIRLEDSPRRLRGCARRRCQFA